MDARIGQRQIFYGFVSLPNIVDKNMLKLVPR